VAKIYRVGYTPFDPKNGIVHDADCAYRRCSDEKKCCRWWGARLLGFNFLNLVVSPAGFEPTTP
jgi:hypothetical protein